MSHGDFLEESRSLLLLPGRPLLDSPMVIAGRAYSFSVMSDDFDDLFCQSRDFLHGTFFSRSAIFLEHGWKPFQSYWSPLINLASISRFFVSLTGFWTHEIGGYKKCLRISAGSEDQSIRYQLAHERYEAPPWFSPQEGVKLFKKWPLLSTIGCQLVNHLQLE